MTQKFAVDESRKNIYLEDEPKERTYQVRALYRGVIASAESTATLEEPWQLPNGDMEEWYWSQIHEDSWLNVFDSDTYTVYPWAENNSSFWNTNNDFTTRNRGTFSNIYNSFPAVSFIDESHSDNWAVELRNTGNGRGNTQPSNVLEMNKVAGELFIGDINIFTGGTDAIPSGDKYTITEGRTFSARPTALKFWYKYIPLNSDTWRVKLKLIDNEGNTIIEKDENGYFAFVPELKGCVSEGETFEEVKSNIKEAIELYLESMSEDELKQLENKDYSITPIEVAVER